MSQRILIIDTYYPDVLRTFAFWNGPYEEELRLTLDPGFGTGDFYSRNLRALGWETMDVIVNHHRLQGKWAEENGNPRDILSAQIDSFKPDVIFLQDLNVLLPKTDALVVGQCSCPLPPESKLRQCHTIFSSFPHYVERFKRMGINGVYNPLAFEPSIIDKCFPGVKKRDNFGRLHDVVFIGGVGNPSHWRNGMETLEMVAREIPKFCWWGYGYETLPSDSALRSKYVGNAWGVDMYQVMLQSKIVLNRHGEVAQGYTNNMRCFEATGCGALMMTERSLNLRDFFEANEAVGYGSPEEAVYLIKRYLENDDERQFIAKNGQQRTLRDHTYAQRMKTVSDTLRELLAPELPEPYASTKSV